MSRLVNYGTGEILDRLSILGLKLVYGSLQGKDTTHWRNEKNVLLTKLNVSQALSGVILEHAAELFGVNAALWSAEDELRAMREVYPGLEKIRQETAVQIHEPLQKAVACAFRIQQLNDRRSELISLINVNTGDKSGPEKLT